MIGESPLKVLNTEGLTELNSLFTREMELGQRIANLSYLFFEGIPATQEEKDDIEIDEQILIGDTRAFAKKWRKE